MSLESHLAQLQRKHQALEGDISSELSHASVNTLKLAELKRKKLKLKEEIEKLRVMPAELRRHG